MDINNFVIDHVIRGTAFSQADGSVLFTINQIQNPSLSCSSESTDAVDALGTPIATFYRAKNAEFSAENAIFDMNLLAVQMGTTKKVGTNAAKITVPAFETITIDGSASYNLKHTAKAIPNEIYKLNGDSTLGTKYTKSAATPAAASTTDFVMATAGTTTTLTPPTGLSNGDELYVMYEYETADAVEVVNSAKNFPSGVKFVMEVLGCDVCDQTTQVFAYLIFDNAKLSPDFDWSKTLFLQAMLRI